MKVLWSLLATAGLILAQDAAASAADDVIWLTDLEKARETARETHRPLVLFVTTTGCPYCVKMKKETLHNPAVIAEIKDKYVPVIIDRGAQPALEKRLAVTLYPTIVIIEADDTEVRRLVGYSPASTFAVSLKRIEAEWLASHPRPETTVK